GVGDVTILLCTAVLWLGGEGSFVAGLVRAATHDAIESLTLLRLIGLLPLAIATAALVPLWQRTGVARTPEPEPTPPPPPAEPRAGTSPILHIALVVVTFGVLLGLTLVLWLGDDTTFAMETLRRLTFRYIDSA